MLKFYTQKYEDVHLQQELIMRKLCDFFVRHVVVGALLLCVSSYSYAQQQDMYPTTARLIPQSMPLCVSVQKLIEHVKLIEKTQREGIVMSPDNGCGPFGPGYIGTMTYLKQGYSIFYQFDVLEVSVQFIYGDDLFVDMGMYYIAGQMKDRTSMEHLITSQHL